jgi:hypothetical protein
MGEVRSFEDDLANSTADFERVVAPKLREWSDSETFSVEKVTDNEMANKLDEVAGIDTWQVNNKNNIVRGVASRVQYLSNLPMDKPPDTFTVRKRRFNGAETEFQKRLKAIRKGGEYPHWTTQAYLDKPGGKLLSLGRVRTEQLIRHIEEGEDGEGYRVQKTNNASFFVVNWWRLDDIGIGVRETRPYKQDSTTNTENQSTLEGWKDD